MSARLTDSERVHPARLAFAGRASDQIPIDQNMLNAGHFYSPRARKPFFTLIASARKASLFGLTRRDFSSNALARILFPSAYSSLTCGVISFGTASSIGGACGGVVVGSLVNLSLVHVQFGKIGIFR